MPLVRLATCARDTWTPPQLVRVAVAHQPYFPPGRGYHYSDTNFILLGLIIEQVTGQPVEDVLRARILRPLGLQCGVDKGLAGFRPQALRGISGLHAVGGRARALAVTARPSHWSYWRLPR